MANHNEIGKIGEKLARSFLMKHGFSIISINESIRYGEIDIIAEKLKEIHFVEVKTIKVNDFKSISNLSFKPEDNFTDKKKLKLKRTIEIYLMSKKNKISKKIFVDLLCVYLNTEKKEGIVKFVKNIEM